MKAYVESQTQKTQDEAPFFANSSVINESARRHHRDRSDHLHRHGSGGFWNGIRAEKSGISRISSFDTGVFHAHCGGEIPDWNPEEFFPPHRLKRLDRYAQFAVASAQLALDDAGIHYSREKPQDRIGVSFGTALGGVCQAEDQHIRFLKKGTRGVNPTLALQVFGGSAHSNIAIEFGFRGVGTTNSNSCASGTVSVGEALALHPGRFRRRGGRGRSRSAPFHVVLRRIRFDQDHEPMGPAIRPFLPPIRSFARRIRHGRRRGVADRRRTRTCPSARRAHLRRSSRLQSEQRRLSHDLAAADRRIVYSSDAAKRCSMPSSHPNRSTTSTRTPARLSLTTRRRRCRSNRCSASMPKIFR